MSHVRVETISYEGEKTFDVDGTVLAVLHHNQNHGRITVLLAVDDVDAEPNPQVATGDPLPDFDDFEPDAEDEDDEFYCVGLKADDSRCTRTVEEAGGRCFQHEEDDAN